MTLAPGTELGRYEIRSKIGEGGMGEVYRAFDPKIGREVAIKVLPADLAANKERVARFEQEAQAAGALNHPNILAIYDVDTQGNILYVVSELLEGEELRDRLEQGPLSVRKAIEYAQQIVSGLCAAHEKGIVHRDLKPENLFITKDERVKILDFGIAKLTTSPQSTNADISEDATRKVLTYPGMIIGTVGYMSPEQVRGAPVDHRSDIFSFGVILYEMLTGSKAFHGDSVVELMNAILKEDVPEFGDDDRRIPASVEKIMHRCLEKKPEHRFHSSHDLGFALEAMSTSSSPGSNRTEAVQMLDTMAMSKRSGWRDHIWMIVAVLLALMLGAALWAPWRSAPRGAALRLTPFSFEQGGQSDAVWSPDGKAVAFAARQKSTDKYQVYVRYVDSPVAMPITHVTESAIPIQWTSAGRIVFRSTQAPAGLWSVSPVGGEPEPLQAIDNPGAAAVSRDGTALAWLHAGDDGAISIWISSPLGAAPTPYEPAPFASRTVLNTPTVKFSPDGKQIIFIRNAGASEEAWWLPYPANASNPPRRILEGLPAFENTPNFSWMPDNRRIVLSGSSGGQPRQLYLADTISGVFSMFSGGTTSQGSPAVSPDGTKLVFRESTGDSDVVSVDLATAAIIPLIATQRSEMMPAWAAREPALVYVTDRNGRLEIWLHKEGQQDRPLVTERDFPPGTTQWFMNPSLSPDASRVIYGRMERGRSCQLWMSAASGGSPVPLVKGDTAATHFAASWSSDGKWFVYWSVEEGKTSLNKVKTTGQADPVVLKTEINREGVWPPIWSPSGDWILHEDEGVKLLSPDGKTTREVSATSAVAYVFSADGKTIYGIRKTAAGDRLELFSISVTGGIEKVIGSLALEYLPITPANPGVRLSLTPDGKSITYSITKNTSNLWLMEGLDTVAMPR
jgi:serine/threonine protein kinase/Tol biopolymer transport system component